MEGQSLGQSFSLLLRLSAILVSLYLFSATGHALARHFEASPALLLVALALSSAALWLTHKQVSPTSGARYRFRPRLIAAFGFFLYVGWGALVHLTPTSDFLGFYKTASAFAAAPNLHTLGDSKSAITVLAYSTFFALFGSSHILACVAAAAFWAAQMPILYYALVALGVDAGCSALATVAYGLAPGTVLYAPILSTEAVFNFLLVLGLLALGRYKRTAQVGYVVALSATCGLLFLTRANGFLFVAPIAAAGLRLTGQRSRLPIVSLALAVPFTLLVAAQAALNYHHTGGFSILGSPYGALNLLAGTNRESGGSWNSADERLAGFVGPERVSLDEASANARRIAFERISDDPIAFLQFALTTKIAVMWDNDAQGLEWSIAGSPIENSFFASLPYRLLEFGTNGFYILVLALAGTFFLLAGIRPATMQVSAVTLFLLTAPILLVGLSHLVLECQNRYHVPLMPLIYVAATLALSQLFGEQRANSCDAPRTPIARTKPRRA